VARNRATRVLAGIRIFAALAAFCAQVAPTWQNRPLGRPGRVG